MMAYDTFLAQVITEGIAACEKDYAKDTQTEKREGAIAGFEVCRGKSPVELGRILANARARLHDASRELAGPRRDGYWRIRCFEAEVEWVCNVVSAALMNNGEPVIIQPTARGVLKAAAILGTKTP